jgi:hypothetical protein
MTTAELIHELKTITNANLEVLKSRFLHLSEEQKKWKLVDNSWNVSEVFAHLNQFAKYYHETFKSKINKTRFRTPSDVFISSPLGRSAWKSMKLGNANNVKRKFKSQRINNPLFEKNLISGNDLEDFKRNLEELNLIIDSSTSVNLRKVKIPISISTIIRLKLGDALLFVAYHNQRHLQQALNLVNHPNFPK